MKFTKSFFLFLFSFSLLGLQSLMAQTPGTGAVSSVNPRLIQFVLKFLF